ncbi:MAG: DegT/DnrJ/EryC1/StrS family aminotransferase [Alicyclobacillus sp.]|nr:DegT/DnrJ/EryC1/StrS family aminotransferase [Alicyclobacillus sp.]
MNFRYPVSRPALRGNERRYVLDCLDSGWVSSNGPYVERFEAALAAHCQTSYAVACSNGTTALHLALVALGAGPGDEVILPTLTFVATANAVIYCGAKPVFVDVDPLTWNIDPERVEAAVTPQTKGVIAVHLFGHPADMDALHAIADRHGLFVLEDAAEAIGALYRNRPVGQLAHAAAFSFYGNKIVTTGEGGAVTTQQAELAERMRRLRAHASHPSRRYWHDEVGYNYRMTNVQAAIGVGQLEHLDWHIAQRRRVAAAYVRSLQDCDAIVLPVERPWAKSACWMFSILLAHGGTRERDQLMHALAADGIETRPFFYPMHVLPPYRGLQPDADFPVANRVAASGLNLPTYADLTEPDVQWIAETVRRSSQGIVAKDQWRGMR